MKRLHSYLGPLLTLGFAMACGTLAILQPPWIADLYAQGYVSFQGDAEKVGTTNTKVVLNQEFLFSGALGDLRQSTVTIEHVLTEAGLDLVAGDKLPLTLFPSRGGKATEVIFRSPDRVRPQWRVELKNRGGGLFTLRSVVEFAASIPPALCRGTPRTTNLTTSFTIAGPGATVPVTTTQAWTCISGDRELVINTQFVPCVHDLCEIGSALDPTCDRCAASICTVDPFCCAVFWDYICSGEVSSVCALTCDAPFSASARRR
jgi:hypothetical protein